VVEWVTIARMHRVLAVSGIRNLSPASYQEVIAAVRRLAPGFEEVRFGGALGSDTVALVAAGGLVPKPHLVVIVPCTASYQPAEARAAIRRYADEVRELGLPQARESYLERNLALIEGATRLLAFSDGRTRGGTAYTMRHAGERGLPIELVLVGATKQ
jgi:hypothetical protein